MDPGQSFEEALVRKVYTLEDCATMEDFVLKLEPEDTLDLLPGKYFYALKLHMDHIETDSLENNYVSKEVDKVITLINKTKFIIND
jgi:hypothetical protein